MTTKSDKDGRVFAEYLRHLKGIDRPDIQLLRKLTNAVDPNILIRDVVYGSTGSLDTPWALLVDLISETKRENILFHRGNRMYPTVTRFLGPLGPVIYGYDSRVLSTSSILREANYDGVSSVRFGSSIWRGDKFRPGKLYKHQVPIVAIEQSIETPEGPWSVCLKYEPRAMGNFVYLFSFFRETDTEKTMPGRIFL